MSLTSFFMYINRGYFQSKVYVPPIVITPIVSLAQAEASNVPSQPTPVTTRNSLTGFYQF